MGFDILWWHWVAFGILLSIAEVFIPSFTVIWFGIGAILAGFALLFFGVGFNTQILVWALSSSAMAACWFLFIHPRIGSKPDKVQPEWKNRQGTVRKAGGGMEKGTVEFQTPLLGDTSWPFVSDEAISEGDRVDVTGVEGQFLRVSRTAGKPGTTGYTDKGVFEKILRVEKAAGKDEDDKPASAGKPKGETP